MIATTYLERIVQIMVPFENSKIFLLLSWQQCSVINLVHVFCILLKKFLYSYSLININTKHQACRYCFFFKLN